MKAVSVEAAAEILREGGVVLAPTETVVGLVAAEHGRRRLSEVKHRDPEKPIALLCATREEAFQMVPYIPALAEKLAERYWPGPLTLVMRKKGGGTIGVRVPDHGVIGGLLGSYGGPLYATSANLAGEPAPAAVEEVDPRIVEAVDAIVEGETGAGEASAVVDLADSEARLLRANEVLDETELRRIAGETRENV